MNSPAVLHEASRPSICFVGLNNLPALAAEYRHHGMGGAELQQVILGKSLAARGFDVSMVVGDLGQEDGSVWHGVRTFKAYRADAGLPGLRFFHPRWTSVAAAMKRAAARIYYSSTAGPLAGQLAMFARGRGARTVFRIAHDYDCFPGRLLIPNWHGKQLYRYGVKHVDLILAQTATQQAAMLQNFARDSRVIPSLLEFSGDNRAFADRDIDVLWVSNIRPFKRPDRALEFAARAPQVRLHMVGGTQSGAESYYEEIRGRAATLPNVQFHGPLPYDEVNRLAARTRVLINTSDSEGFPNTYLQAWSRGTPVVGFFDPDGVIKREGVGRTATTVVELEAAVGEYLADQDSWLTTSRRCIEYVSARHGAGAVDMYAEALAELSGCPEAADR